MESAKSLSSCQNSFHTDSVRKSIVFILVAFSTFRFQCANSLPLYSKSVNILHKEIRIAGNSLDDRKASFTNQIYSQSDRNSNQLLKMMMTEISSLLKQNNSDLFSKYKSIFKPKLRRLRSILDVPNADPEEMKCQEGYILLGGEYRCVVKRASTSPSSVSHTRRPNTRRTPNG